MAPLYTGSYAETMTVHQLPFGVLLRRWRERRRMTQADLALAAKSSTRHLSCLETGRSQPSREMIARLAEYLGIPLRDQNALLLAAGFAPAFKDGMWCYRILRFRNFTRAVQRTFCVRPSTPCVSFCIRLEWAHEL